MLLQTLKMDNKIKIGFREEGEIMGKRILLFGGTYEGRKIAEYLTENSAEFTLSVATDYGNELTEKSRYMDLKCGRLNSSEITELVGEYDLVIDATHPYAEEISSSISQACIQNDVEMIRVLRSETEKSSKHYCFADIKEAVNFLDKTSGNIFVSTGSKEIAEYSLITNASERLYARVLPTAEAIEACRNAGLKNSHIICMQGPFSEDLNMSMFKETSAGYIVTKSSGSAGGFDEKISAADNLGIKTVIIGRKPENKGITLEETISMISGILNTKRKITLIGIGAGIGDLTEKAVNALKYADIIIGSSRILDSLRDFKGDRLNEYRISEIIKFIEVHNEYNNIVLAFSGDIGFYSGAIKNEFKGYDIEKICGISSLQTLCSRMGISWENVRCVSMHGRNADVLGEVISNKRVFILGEKGTVNTVCGVLIKAGCGKLRVTVGEKLSYDDEKITSAYAEELADMDFSALSVMMIENDSPVKPRTGIPDSEFVRGNVPMTKSEVRSVLLSKINFKNYRVIYDIGAGTGSVSVELAVNNVMGTVYSIEKNPEAVSLIHENIKKFGCYNIIISEGTAPEILDSLPDPDCVFIGGSSGNIKNILEKVKSKNRSSFISLNTVTAEGFADAVSALRELNAKNVEITQLAVSHSQQAGEYHIMKAENPVYIITAEGFE